MKVLATTIALLSVSSAAANDFTDIFQNPYHGNIIAKYLAAEPATNDEVFLCMDELVAFADCIGTECIECVVDVFEDIGEDATCESVKASSFCTDLVSCAVGDCAHVEAQCNTDDLVKCMEDNYPDAEAPEDPCPGLCDATEVPSTTDEAVVLSESAHDFTDIFQNPYHGSIIAKYLAAEPATADEDEEFLCMDELVAFGECIGDECIECVVDIFEDIGEDATCESVEASSFCTDLESCAVGDCAHVEAQCNPDALVKCIEDNYPDYEAPEEPCPGLCEAEEVPSTLDVVDVFTRPQMGAIMASYYAESDEAACEAAVEGFAACVGLECATCLGQVFSDIGDDPTCDSLMNSDFCADLTACGMDPCAGVTGCGAEVDALAACEEEAGDKDGEECEGLCEGEKLFAAIA